MDCFGSPTTKRDPALGARRDTSFSPRSSLVRYSRISACSGSVSWNSSTRRCVKRVANARRTAGKSRRRSRVARSRSAYVNGPLPARRAARCCERGAQDGVDPLVQRELPLGERGLDDALAKSFEFLAQPLRQRLVRPPLYCVAPPWGRRVLRRRAKPAGVAYSGSCSRPRASRSLRLEVVAPLRARLRRHERNCPF